MIVENEKMNARKSIFITGGASGIGRATAQYFAAKGWFVGIADVNDTGMAETVAMLPTGQSSFHKLDVRDRKQWDIALADFVKAAGGRIDVLFNNAGIPAGGPFGDETTEHHDRVIDINLRGVIYGAEAGFSYLKDNPGSCLLNTCSAAGLMAGPGMAIYAVTKFGVRALTEALEGEWAPHGIKVCSLMPSFIDTPLLDANTSGSNRNVRQSVTELGLEITPVERVAEAAWAAAHGKKTHTLVGKTAVRLGFLLNWVPWLARMRYKRTGV